MLGSCNVTWFGPVKAALLGLAGVLSIACQSQTAVPPPAQVSAIARIPLARLLDGVVAENKRMEDIHASSYGSGILLGQLNGKLQSHGYFRRVPTDSALDGLESQLRQFAVDKLLTVTRVEKHMVPGGPTPAPVPLKAGQRWQPTVAQLRGVAQVSLDLQGATKDVAAFIDALVQSIERLVVVTGASAIEGGVRLTLETYFERELPPPQVDIRWPTLEERLTAAGWDANDSKLQVDPLYTELKKEVLLGRQRLPDVRRTLQITADFPRWLLRYQFFEERAAAAAAVRGADLLNRSGLH